MSKHTLVFAVHQPNVKYLKFLISTVCYHRKIEMVKVSLKNSIDFTSLIPILFCIIRAAHLIQRLIANIGHIYKTDGKSEKFSRNIDRNFIVLGDILIGDTSLYYRQEVSVTLSIGIKSSFAMYFWRHFS